MVLLQTCYTGFKHLRHGGPMLGVVTQGSPMCPAQLASSLKIHQLDPDLQLRVKELSLTTLGEFRAMARQIKDIQVSRWIRRTREQEPGN